jgi:tetratricopeptide (TPR) repeat protein
LIERRNGNGEEVVPSQEEPTDELPAAGWGAGTAVADPPVIAPGRRLGDRYVLRRRLGHGGMAVVWLATDERLGRSVAVKVLSDAFAADAEYLERFAREARLAAGLQHPNLVAVYDYDAGERPYLVMECVEGGDLAALVAAHDAPPVKQLAEELLAALAHIHAAGILHRDIKPQNVLVDRYGSARLTDFGIAMPAGAASLTRTGHVIGTESYLAPEVKRGASATERSDLYALGVVLADAARDGADADFWRLVDRLRDADPDARPASAAAALDELAPGAPGPPAGEPTRPFEIEEEEEEEAVAAEGPTRAVFEPTPTGVRSRRRERWLVIGGLAAVALVAAALALAGGSDDGGGTPTAERRGSDTGGSSSSASQSGGGGGGAAGSGGATEAETADEPVASEPQPDESSGAVRAPADQASTDPAALNDQGFALVNEERFDEAIPVLEDAVDGLRGSGDEATYNYAIYNLATAYLGAGQPAEAIPLLEERMRFDDGQLAEVGAALDRAYEEAGVEPPGDTKPGNGPPPWAGGEHEDD